MCTFNYKPEESGSRKNEEENTAMAASLRASDALILATMSLIELPVDVHAKDGSVYSGIFYTASVDSGYAIVLKNARMIKKGNLAANVANESVIEMFVVRSEDLVQVVAKDVPSPSSGVSGYANDGFDAIVGINECLETKVKANESNGDEEHPSETRIPASSETNFACTFAPDVENQLTGPVDKENERAYGADFGKMEKAHIVSAGGRRVRNVLAEKESNHKKNPDFQDEETNRGVQGSSIGLDACQSESTAADDIFGKKDMQKPLEGSPVPPKGSSLSQTAKEFKLNPGAKVFSPSVVTHGPVTPAVQTEASIAYVPDFYAMVPISTTENEDGIGFAPYTQSVAQMFPMRYASQYLQTGTAYVYQNSQNVIAGLAWPVVCVYPMTDTVDSAVAYSQAATGPIQTPHHMHHPKQQEDLIRTKHMQRDSS